MKKSVFLSLLCIAAVIVSGCGTTKTQYVAQGGSVQAITGFSQDDVDDVISRAVQSIIGLDRIKIKEGASRAVVVVRDVTNDTSSRGRDAEALAEMLGLSLREELTNCGKVVVYNEQVAANATVKVTPQYILYGRLTQRNLRQDDGDIQLEYSLNLQFVELATGLEFWQKRIPLRKLAARKNVM